MAVLKEQDALIARIRLHRTRRVVVGRAHERHVTVHVWPHLSHATNLTLHMNTVIIRQDTRRPVLITNARAHLTVVGGDSHVNQIVALGMEDTQPLPDETDSGL